MLTEEEYAAKARMEMEINQQQEKIRRLEALLAWAFQLTRDTLMISAQRPRTYRAARDNALAEINKRLGAEFR